LDREHQPKEKTMETTRREALGAAFLASASTLALLKTNAVWAGDSPSRNKPGAGVQPGQHAPVPLPFDVRKLRGISEKMMVSHWENNYGAAVKNLNKVEEELMHINKDSPGFLVSGLKERELTYSNSLILHELYFGNLGGDGKPGGAVHSALADAYGGAGRWEEHFRATGSSLGGGSGWTVLDWNLQTGTMRIYWSSNHTQALAFGAPLLVMDMYEHAYQMDYGAGAGKYIEAFVQNIHWHEVNRRYERAVKLGALYGTR
jgi:superoxide dismutase, Fe-Mn family